MSIVVIATGDGVTAERPATLDECDNLTAQAHALYRRADKRGGVLQAMQYAKVVDQLLEFRREFERAALEG